MCLQRLPWAGEAAPGMWRAVGHDRCSLLAGCWWVQGLGYGILGGGPEGGVSSSQASLPAFALQAMLQA